LMRFSLYDTNFILLKEHVSVYLNAVSLPNWKRNNNKVHFVAIKNHSQIHSLLNSKAKKAYGKQSWGNLVISGGIYSLMHLNVVCSSENLRLYSAVPIF
jgi:tRNA A37 threonylcarbamoyltransferase TsaD